jgi:DNA repair protein RecO (recombination protein O)
MAESVNGILVRRIRYSDTSLILTWFTDLHGKIKTIAKGALRQKSAFAGKLDLFFLCDLLFSFSSKTELHLLREVAIKTTFEGIRTSYLKTSVASYFVELVENVTELDHPSPEIYSLLLRALGYLDRQSPETRGILFFESELCKCLGLYTPDTHSSADKLVETYGQLPKSRATVLCALTAQGSPN